MHYLKLINLFVLIVFIPSFSYALSITLPAEKGEFKKADLPGYNIAVQKCLICHSQNYIQYQPPSISRKAWENEVKKMKDAFKAPITDEEIPLLAEYLTKIYGNEQSSYEKELKLHKASLLSATTTQIAITAPPKQHNDNNCLTCHSVTTKIVGPAFKDVAAKYKNDLKAIEKITVSIKNGGSGKWGAIPMPPQPQIKDADLKIISQWVLNQ